ncbi:hypothetical protein [Lactiplantibacillus paraplantarum]|uniref:hypothetical protein n=1 Tax=Lactiplantibacillus paraplantarum TaxID=60520 RepID=UPI0023AAA293|nr:hypothetical protein [Lactiplantibacillus paraplantarum]WEE36055.1 hypothetical protein PWO93_00240 [Lactiplantibacillus paraplantarum]
MSNEKHFVDLVMEALRCGVGEVGSNQSESVLWQYASYRETDFRKLVKYFNRLILFGETLEKVQMIIARQYRSRLLRLTKNVDVQA